MKLTVKMALAIAAVWVSGLISGIVLAPQAFACDGVTYYDPAHMVCQPNAPAYSPGYLQPPTNGNPGPQLPYGSRQYPY